MAQTTTFAKSKKGVAVLLALCMMFFYTGRLSSSSGGGASLDASLLRGFQQDYTRIVPLQPSICDSITNKKECNGAAYHHDVLCDWSYSYHGRFYERWGCAKHVFPRRCSEIPVEADCVKATGDDGIPCGWIFSENLQKKCCMRRTAVPTPTCDSITNKKRCNGMEYNYGVLCDWANSAHLQKYACMRRSF